MLWDFSNQPEFGRINLHHQNHKIFKLVCKNKHLNVAQWLTLIEPKYQIIGVVDDSNDSDHNGSIRYQIN